jgi:hypothetical protein
MLGFKLVDFELFNLPSPTTFSFEWITTIGKTRKTTWRHLVWFEVLTAASMKMAVLWIVAPCGLVCLPAFRRRYCLHHQGDEISLVNLCQSTGRYNPADRQQCVMSLFSPHWQMPSDKPSVCPSFSLLHTPGTDTESFKWESKNVVVSSWKVLGEMVIKFIGNVFTAFKWKARG